MTTNYYIHSFESVLQGFQGVCSWFDSLGFRYAQTRYGIYQRLFADLKANARAPKTQDELRNLKRRFDNAYLEANEIIRVHSELSKICKGEFLEQIEKVLSGRELRNQSADDSARNFLFELSVACRFLRAEYSVYLTDICDVVVDFGTGTTLFVECKRIKSIDQIRANISKASKQVSRRVTGHKPQSAIGLIAINITDLLAGIELLMPDSEAAGSQLHKFQMRSFLAAHPDFFSKSGKLDSLGILCESARVMYLSKRSPMPGLIYSRHATMIPYGKPGSARHQMVTELSGKLANQDIFSHQSDSQ